MFQAVIFMFRSIWWQDLMSEAGMAQYRKRLPPTNVARIRLQILVSYVGQVCCWFSSLLREVFLWILRFSPPLKNQQFQIPIRSGAYEQI